MKLLEKVSSKGWALLEGDCLELMKDIPDQSIDMILCDLPYGTTACKWDSIIPLKPLWEEYKRLIKDNGAIVLTASQPFTTKLISSNYDMYKYCWYWNKIRGVGHLNAKKRPMMCIEDICIFYNSLPTYNPQMRDRENPRISKNKSTQKVYGQSKANYVGNKLNKKYPINLINFSKSNQLDMLLHPTQKPVKLFEYLIRTYTNEGDLVLDNCAGSGTTGVACYNLNRDCIMIEQEQEYCQIIKDRMKEIVNQERLV